MIEKQAWQENNDAYLSAAVEWIRLRLLRLAARAGTPAELQDRGNPKRRFFAAQESLSLTPDIEAPSDKEVARAKEALDKCAASAATPAALMLKRRFDLSEFELQILMLCASTELDTRAAGLCARAQANPARPWPTYALALALFDEAAWEALSPKSPLRYWRLIEINQPAGVPLAASAVRADERIVNYLKGLNFPDDRLTLYLAPLATDGTKLASSHAKVAETLAHSLTQNETPKLVHLLGSHGASKRAIATQAAEQLSISLYQAAADLLPSSAADLETLARLWRRETALLPVGLYLDASESERDAPAVSRFLARASGLIFLDTRDSWRSVGRDALTVDVRRPEREEQREAWTEQTGNAELAGMLASQFQLGLPEIRRAVRRVAHSDNPKAEEGLWDECCAASRPRLDMLAQRLDAKATWEDLVLPETETANLREIAAQARRRSTVYDDWGFASRMNRGLGISALFAGESGTGKTMAAEVIANDLRLNLYRIDLSAVVSKYIGETEKNLRQVFDAAEDGGTILFFDEADALFGKRSEVKDSHDRYANIEINYLLQRMESYSGLAILATNLKSALDTAFLRRLRFIVQFPFPGAAERKRIWQRAFPSRLPSADLDFDFLSRLNVAGGTVQNIALRSAFRAAETNSTVTMPVVLEAARAEFQKLERPINEADFRWQQRAHKETNKGAAA